MNKYDPVESMIAFFEKSQGNWTFEMKSSLHVAEDIFKWGGIVFKRFDAIDGKGGFLYELHQNGREHKLTKEQGEKVFSTIGKKK